MRRTAWGDLAVAAVFAAMGAVWVWQSRALDLWNRETPGPGFLPLAFGALLLALALIAAAQAVLAPAPAPEGDGGLAKPLLVLGAVGIAVLGLEAAGFVPAIFLMLLALFALAERKPLLPSLLVSAAVAGALHVIFAVWLAVPLPPGIFGRPFGD
jgi:putative tricarboxylic transport membrane protein